MTKVFALFALAVLLVTTGCGSGSGSSGGGSVSTPAPGGTFTGLNIDYAPEGRCSDDNWSTTTPAACNPQLAFTSCQTGVLSSCAANCQTCYNTDIATIK